MGPAPQGESCEGGKVPAPRDVSSPSRRSSWMEGELQNANPRVICIEGWHRHPALLNMRYSSVSVGGGQVLKLRLWRSVSGRGPGLGAETA